MIVDATNMIVGRMSVHVAKAALLGEEVHVINCEKAIFSGSSDKVIAHFVHRYHRGVPAKGPYVHRKSFEIVKRVIRGMVPYRKAHGEAAFARIKCYNGVPRALEGKETVSFSDASKDKLPVYKFVTVGEISQRLGAKQ
jgi:large subunit ribosomal protein L13